MTALTTHVLDLTSGLPAAGVAVTLHRRGADAEAPPLAARSTDADGRARLLEHGELAAGAYRLAFDIGAHFARTATGLTDPPFLDVVVIDFTVADAARHHHVPLLISPYGYSTYRGS
jgi:5-hydroxyisourate hydrolase